MVSAGRGRSSTLTLLVFLAGAVQASPQTTHAAPLTDITVLFKLDARLSGGTYGGERWLSPPTFTSAAQGGTVGTVEARVKGIDDKGRRVDIVPEWTATHPEMVTVTPGEGDAFRITVKRVGESRLKVASQGISKELRVKATYLGQAIQVEVTQELAKHPPSGASTPGPPAAGAATSPDAGMSATGGASPLRDQKAKNSYALGMEMASKLKGQVPELDPDLVSRGIRDVLAGDKPLLTEGELMAALTQLRNEAHTRQAVALKGLADKNSRDGAAFLAENRTKEGVITLESGLQYKVLKAGDGPKPTRDDSVVCHYRGLLVDGTEFDSSYRRQRPATVALGRVIKGWREALQLMPVGSKWQIVVPSNLAYGAKPAAATIGPNATLVFEVDLLSIKDRPLTTLQTTPTPKKRSEDKSI